jgi:hypothetical protein
MIEVDEPIDKDLFIEALKREELNIFKRTIKERTNIYIKQQGAGSGKTWTIIQLIKNTDFDKYDNFIYLTKQHSAVNVIKTELDKQIKNNELPNIEIISFDKDRKKYIIKVKNIITNKIKKLIIGTIDSFIWSIGNTNINGIDKFKKMVEEIIDNNIRCDGDGCIKYTKSGTFLNLKTLIIGDEMQDLHKQYANALIKICRDKFVDFYAVGDKMQSISNEDNAFTYLFTDFNQEDIIEIIGKNDKTNVCRRFTDKNLINFVNHMIPFNKFDLPEIKSYKDDSDDKKSLILFPGKNIRSDEIDELKIKEEVEKIIGYYIDEVELYNRKPNDFLFVTPFVNKNPLVDEINTRLRDYWINKIGIDEYNKYSIFHKSEEGTSIDLSQSDNATRIVSIHSSKGDGRPVVFLIGITESSLQHYSNDNDNLIFYSLLHVALTRQKEKLYIRYEPNGDKIHDMIENYTNESNKVVKPCLNKSIHIKFNTLIQHNKDINFDIINKHLINNIDLNNLDEKNNCESMLIDMQHHNIRYSCFTIMILLQILSISIKNNNNYKEQSIYQILKKLSKIKFENVSTTLYYKFLRNSREYIKKKEMFPCLQYKNGKYKKYFDELKKLLETVKLKIKNYIISGENEFDWLECVCLYYMIDIYDNGAYNNFSINDLYDIIDLSCKITDTDNEIYIKEHHKKLKLSKKICDNMVLQYPNMKYLLNHKVTYNGENSYFSIFKQFTIIAYNDTNINIINIKPQFTSINYNEILLESLFNTFIIDNVKKINNESDITEDYKRFNNKIIKTCVLTFDNNCNPYYIDWDVEINKKKIILDIIKQNMMSHYKMEHKKIYNYVMYYIHDEKLNIKQINNEYSKLATYCYKYVEDVFNDIKKYYKKNNNIDIYLDKSYFINKLEIYLEEQIEDYLNV